MRLRLAPLALVLLVGSIAPVSGQEAQLAPKPQTEPATRFEKFAARKGMILIRSFYEAPAIKAGFFAGNTDIRGIAVATPGEEEKAFAVIFERITGRGSQLAVIDFDEAVSLLLAIDAIQKIAAEMASSEQPGTEVKFVTRGRFEAGCVQDKGG